MDIRLICLDLDGTALLSDHSTVSPRLLAALEAAHGRGIAIAPVTGRQFGLLPPFLREHPLWEGLVVLCNGAQIRTLGTGELLHSLHIPSLALELLLELAERYDLPIEFSVDSTLHLTGHSLVLQRDDPGLKFHRDTILTRHGRVVDSLEPMCGGLVEKVNLLCIPEELRETVVRDLEEIEVSAVWASGSSMEITHALADKGSGVRELCRLLEVPMEGVLALGDSGNDVTMLREAGWGVAMGNAPEPVKAAANAVTESNIDDGAAIAIERYALERSTERK